MPTEDQRWDRLFKQTDKMHETLNGITSNIAVIKNDQKHAAAEQEKTNQKVTQLFARTESNATSSAVLNAKLVEHMKDTSAHESTAADSEGESRSTIVAVIGAVFAGVTLVIGAIFKFFLGDGA